MSPKKSVARAQAYTESGVDINAGNDLVTRIKSMVASTRIQGVYSDIGGFGGLFKPDMAGMEAPVLVASTDGVGTKIKLASMFGKFDTVGIDLVAMCVNDIIVQGARPLFFLDYFATGKLDVDQAEQVIRGIADGCRQAGCALLGGETAEMPDMYQDGDFDLAGFSVGLVDSPKIVDGSGISVGDVMIGLASSGVHSNGFSLVRKLFAESGAKADDIMPGTERSFKDILLEPTIIYVDLLKSLMRDLRIKGMVHITGGGFYDNIPRVLPNPVQAKINFGSWKIPPVFNWLKEQGQLDWPAMLQIFNCGIGFVLLVDKHTADEIMVRLDAMNEPAWVIGQIEHRGQEEAEQVEVVFA